MFNNYGYPNTMNYLNTSKIIEVNGINGANAYPLGPNSSVLLLDNSLPVVYMKISDDAGYSVIKEFNIIENKPKTNDVDLNSIEERLIRLEEIVNAKSIVTESKSKPKKSATDTDVGTK